MLSSHPPHTDPHRRAPHLLGWWVVLILALGWGLHALAVPGRAQTPTYTLYLPLVAREAKTCAPLSPQEQAVLDRLLNHPDQRHQALICNDILQRVARERALDMGQRNYFSHVTPEGYGPNYLVRQAGYPLPTWYSQAVSANNIESIAYYAATVTPDWRVVVDEVWQGWMDSPPHRDHLLGATDFYAAQTEFGIGYANVPDERWAYRSYWVVIIAQRGP
jgi:uncharacterized protein YkwD